MASAMDSAEASRSERTMTVRVPGPLYDRIQRSAESQHRPIEEVLLEAAAAALPPLGDLPRAIGDDVAELVFLNDAALWDVARSTPAPALHAELDDLLAGQGRGELSPVEQQRLDELVHAHEVSALVRAQAALLLQRRGYDLSDPAVLSRLP
jgi:hypothetical protein